MGDRTYTFTDCPKCQSKGTFECYEALSSMIKRDECSACGYSVDYEIIEEDKKVTIKRIEGENES